MPSNSITHLNGVPIFEWYLVEYGSKNGYPKNMCLKRLELHAQTMIIIISSSNNQHNWRGPI